MKSIRLLAILLILTGFSCSSVKKIDQKQEVKNIILMIGDGMGLTHAYAAYTANRGKLNLERAQYIGLSKTYSADSYETDSGAGGTALSTGEKTHNRYVGLDTEGLPLPHILEMAEANGLSTGLVATSTITHATPASFIAHQRSRYKYLDIAQDFVNSGIDIFIGGGRLHFEDTVPDNVSEQLREKGYKIVYRLKDIDPSDSSNIGCLAADDALPRISEGRGDYLPRATELALEKLGQNPQGFFIMIEGSQIDWGGHDNDPAYVIEETIDFDIAVGVAFDYADTHPGTLVVVTADHETGGLSIIDGDLETGRTELRFSTPDHTGIIVPVYAYGTGAGTFAGIYENTEINHKMVELFSFEN